MQQSDLTRWRLDISYDGSEFFGWAVQKGQRTVQGVLEEWVQQVLRLSDPVTVMCAGRTDAGVHARGQVAHLDLPSEKMKDNGELLHRQLSRVLPADVVVRSIAPAPAGFHARFAANWRRYIYRLHDGEAGPDPIYRGQITAVRRPIDLDLLNACATELIGLRDFAPFCRWKLGATTIRTLLDLHGSRVESGPMAGAIEITVKADAFCHSMVRSLVGALVSVAMGRRDRAWLHEVINSSTRHNEVLVMPAKGLTLEEVAYPSDDQLVARTIQSRSVRELPT